MSKLNYDEVTPTWADTHKYAPSVRHRRRLIHKLIKLLAYESCVDVGCAQGCLIEEIKIRGGG